MGKSLKVVALVSGGKDSCYSMLQCVSAGHQIVALANLRPKDVSKNELDSYMFQTVGHQAIDLYAEAMNLPLFRGDIKGSSVNTALDYNKTDHDEVEDLLELLQTIKNKIDFDAVCSGAILSDYQRVRVENVCARLGLVSLSYLWRRDQAELFDEMIDSKIEAILIKVATLGLDEKHLGLFLSQVRDHLHKMNAKYGINVCGEGGEYETFTLDCPLFVKKIVIKESEVVIHANDAFAPVAFLQLKSLSLEQKEDTSTSDTKCSQKELIEKSGVVIKGPIDFVSDIQLDEEKVTIEKVEMVSAPAILDKKECQVNVVKNWFSVQNVTSEKKDPNEATEDIFRNLKDLLNENGLAENQIVAVTLLLADMDTFQDVNKAYVSNFVINPPIRVCVEAPIKTKVSLSAIGNRNPIKTMHVQSISHWAPANIGPYSQATLVDNVLHVAGQIGLIPGSMDLPSSVVAQAQLAMRHLIRILQVYQLEATNIVQIVCYVSAADYSSVVIKTWNEQFNDEDWAYEHLLTIVVMPRLPRNAKVEWHAIAAVDRKLSSVKYEKLDDQHTTVSRCLSDENEGEEEECNRLGNRSVLFSSLRLFSEVIDGAWVSLGLPDRNILKVTIYYKSELSALYLNVLLNALKLEGKNGKCVEVFPVLAIANEPNAVLVANIISLKE